MIKARQPEERMDVIEKIMGWATSGYLTVSTRPGLRLYVICTQPPSVAAFDWTERLEIVLSGYGDACWEEIYPATVTAENQTAWTGTIKPGGTRSCYLEYLVTNKASANLTSVTATANGYTIAVTGITVAQGGKVWLHYDQHHFLYILTGATMQTPLVSYRTAASADDILLTPGVSNSFTLTTDVSCDMEVTARGMWR
ncbi:MAG: hypothetical protein IKP40_09040 [Clostridia bacterium]|nr:hypothetical protein [Clostridia bacterium]